MAPQRPPRCPGCPYAGPTVGCSGDPNAEFVIVGESPGVEEIREGKPFVGPSGRILWSTLHKFLDPKTPVFVTNALCCRPPKSNGGQIKKSAIESCRERLVRELKAAPRKVILALGNVALRSITQNYDLKITEERGRAIETEFGIVVPALHPASILRGTGDYRKFSADLRYAVYLLRGGKPKDPGETRYRVIRTRQELERAIAGLIKCKYLAADIETTGFNPRQDKILALGISWDKNKVLIFPDETLPHLKPLFQAKGPRWVWHNGKFDTSFLNNMGLPARIDEDVLLLHYALDEQRGTHDLKQLASDFLGAPDYESEVKKYAPKKGDSFANVPRDILYKYLAKDADYTLQLFHILRRQVDQDPNLRKAYEQVMLPAATLLREVEQHGIWVNQQYLNELGQELEQKLEEDLQRVREAAKPWWDPRLYARQTGAKTVPLQFNPASPKQVAWLLYKAMGLKPGKGHKRDTSKDTLESLPENPVTEALLRLRKTSKMLSTYVAGIRREIEPDGRVHTQYLIHGTVTGRLASRNPNMQNIPRDKRIRGMFQAPPGRVLIELDYSQAELRVLAHLSEDDFLSTVFREGRDLHDEVSIALFGPNFTSEQRMRAKAVNFGIAYGREAYSIALEFGISTAEAQKMIDDWFNRAPKARDFIQWCRRAPLEGRVLVTPFGRKRRFGLVTRENVDDLQNEAANFPIQSTASDLTLVSAMRMQPRLRKYSASVINLVHDSILIEAPAVRSTVDTIVREALRIMEQVPIDTIRAKVPFVAEAKVGKAWGHLKEYHPKN